MAINNQSNQSNPTPTVNQKTGTGFTNLQNILNANQNNKLGQAVQSNITNQTQNVQQNLNQGAQQFAQGLQQNKGATIDSNLEKKIKSAPQTLTQSELGTLNNAKANYSGPTEIGNAKQIGASVQAIQNQTKGLTDTNSRQAVLENMIGGPNYRNNLSAFDSTLLGKTGGQNIVATNQAANALTNNYNNIATGAQNQALQATQEAARNAKLAPELSKSIENVGASKIASMQPRLQELGQIKDALYGSDKVQADPSRALELMHRAGILKDDRYQTIVNALNDRSIENVGGREKILNDLKNYYSSLDPSTLTKTNVLDENSRQAYAALQKLSGNSGYSLDNKVDPNAYLNANLRTNDFIDRIDGSINQGRQAFNNAFTSSRDQSGNKVFSGNNYDNYQNQALQEGIANGTVRMDGSQSLGDVTSSISARANQLKALDRFRTMNMNPDAFSKEEREAINNDMNKYGLGEYSSAKSQVEDQINKLKDPYAVSGSEQRGEYEVPTLRPKTLDEVLTNSTLKQLIGRYGLGNYAQDLLEKKQGKGQTGPDTTNY